MIFSSSNHRIGRWNSFCKEVWGWGIGTGGKEEVMGKK
jgi:hypothetical protein